MICNQVLKTVATRVITKTLWLGGKSLPSRPVTRAWDGVGSFAAYAYAYAYTYLLTYLHASLASSQTQEAPK